jgi:sugar (pentulose or hexulose) kinase
MTPYSLLLDIGGTDIKVGVEINGQLPASKIQRYRIPNFISPEKKEINPEELLALVNRALLDCIRSNGKPLRILVSGQTASWVLTTVTGELKSNIISWQSNFEGDASLCSKIYGEDFDAKQDRLTNNGNENSNGVPWRRVPSLASRFSSTSNQLLFHSLVSWIVWELIKKKRHVIHVSDACATGMVELPTVKWMGRFIEQGIFVNFPEISTEHLPVGFLNDLDVPVYIGIGDQQVSLYGSGLADGEYAINAGTGGQVARLIPMYVESLGKTRPYFGGKYIETFTHIPSGRFLEKYLGYINAQRLDKLDWAWLWERGAIELFDETNPNSLNWDYDTFLETELKSNTNFESQSDKIVVEIVNGFLNRLEAIGFSNDACVVLAGGVASNLKIIRLILRSRYQARLRFPEDSESTLSGLSKLSSLIEN